ncbi:MAG: hypothetical protein HY851_00335 [candidate division Zixibacteria bacterium]|nr:hypothetical protein [candidate division Zixibacteria bacterium]
MTELSSLKNYSDIRRLVPFESFRTATTYISWHNRLSMTHMLETWEALVVAHAIERKPIDEFLFSAVKGFLDRTRDQPPASLEECRTRGDELIGFLYSQQP